MPALASRPSGKPEGSAFRWYENVLGRLSCKTRSVFSLPGRSRLRFLSSELYATSSRIDWRTLLKRTFEVDLRVCVQCGGKLTVRAVFSDPASVAKLLAALRCPRAPPTAA